MWTVLQTGDEIPEKVEEGIIILVTDFDGRANFKRKCKQLARDCGVPYKIVFLIPLPEKRIPKEMYPYFHDLYSR